MTDLLVLMGALLAIGIFFEDYSRARAHRATDRARSEADRIVARFRYLLADGSTVGQDDLERAFRLPGSVETAPRLSYGLAVTNSLLFILIVLRSVGQHVPLDPIKWDPILIGAAVALVCHLTLSCLVWKSEREIAAELSVIRRDFADDLVSQIRLDVLGPPGGATPLVSDHMPTRERDSQVPFAAEPGRNQSSVEIWLVVNLGG
jgi:hypothetical protein